MAHSDDGRRYRMDVKGLTSLIMHSNAGMLGEPQDTGRDKLQWEKDHILERTYRNASGQLIIPGYAIRKMLINGCRFVTDKPKGASFKSFAPLIEATAFIEEDLVLDVATDKIIPYVAIVNLNPSKGPKGPRGPRCRPMIPVPWGGSTYVTLIDAAVTQNHFEKIADISGRLCGLLDGRPLGFGRCEITVRAA